MFSGTEINKTGLKIDLGCRFRLQGSPIFIRFCYQGNIIRILKIGSSNDAALSCMRSKFMRYIKLLQTQNFKATIGKMIAGGRTHRAYSNYNYIEKGAHKICGLYDSCVHPAILQFSAL